jgi:hypothetical protein
MILPGKAATSCDNHIAAETAAKNELAVELTLNYGAPTAWQGSGMRGEENSSSI